MNTNFAYDKMDYYSILEYLKEQAVIFSNGDWTDFSDADIGTVILKLMAMNSDTTNYQIEKGISELYLDTVIERVNAIALCKLIGYEPRHYESAQVILNGNYSGADFNTYIEAYTQMGAVNDDITYYTIERTQLKPGLCDVMAYEGKYKRVTHSFEEIDENGRLYFDDYNVGTNTVTITQGGAKLKKVENALYGEGENCFSIHIDLSNRLYIQFPPYYKTILSNNVAINVDYLLSSGVSGSVGAETISNVINLGEFSYTYINNASSFGGYNPETVEEIRKQAPAYASTMDTLVTLNDFRILVKDHDGIADVVALDYNFPESGLIQPTDDQVNDAYKVNLYILPDEFDNIYQEVEDDETGFNLLGLSELTVDPVPAEYPMNFDVEDGYFYNTNHNDDTVSMVRVILNEGYAKLKIAYEVSTEAGFDKLNISTINGTLVESSGINSGYEILEDVPAGTTITLRYTKDERGTANEDLVKVWFYGMITEPPVIYSDKLIPVVDVYSRDVKKKKPAGILVTNYNVDYIRPHIVMNVYMNESDLRYSTTAESVKEFLVDTYSRKYKKIGEAVYTSHIAKDIIGSFDYINYIDIISVEYSVNGAIKPNNKEFIEILYDNITVNVMPYEES